jgi:hypothetical protein
MEDATVRTDQRTIIGESHYYWFHKAITKRRGGGQMKIETHSSYFSSLLPSVQFLTALRSCGTSGSSR